MVGSFQYGNVPHLDRVHTASWCSRAARRLRAVGVSLGMAWPVASSGCSARAELPRLVVRQSGLVVEGVRGASEKVLRARVPLSGASGFEFPYGVAASLWVSSVSATAEAGVPDLAFIRQVTLVASETEGDASWTLLDHRPSGDPVRGPTVTAFVEEPVDLLALLRTEDILYELTLAGTLPARDWSLSVAITFEMELSVKLDEHL